MKKKDILNVSAAGKVVGIIDVLIEKRGLTYLQAVKELFNITNTQFNFSEYTNINELDKNYLYPKEEENEGRSQAESYLAKRGISIETLNHVGIKQDKHGNIIYPYRSLNGTLVSAKYRPARRIKKGEAKMWFQKDSNNCPSLFNMQNVNIEKPLLVTEGECFPKGVEILTKNGWVKFEEYSGEEVMQIDENMKGTFVKPKSFIKKIFDGDLYRIKRGGNYTSITTPNHNLVYFTNKHKLIKRPVSEMPRAVQGYIPTAIKYNGVGTGLSESEMAFYIAISADAKVDVRKNGDLYARVSFKKERKIIRFENLLNNIGVKYIKTIQKSKPDFTFFGIHLPKWFESKIFPNEWINKMTLNERLFFIEEMKLWDGNSVKGRKQYEYSSKYEQNAIFVQTIASTCGYMSHVMFRTNQFGSWYKVSILLEKNSVSWCNINPEKVYYKDFVYCVTVDTGMILVRQEEDISVSGNCDSLATIEAGFSNSVSVPYGSQDHKWIEFNYEWLENFEKIIIWADDDMPGQKMISECIPRLGNYRCYYVSVTEEIKAQLRQAMEEKRISDCKADANNVLIACGKETVLWLINNAKEMPSKKIKYLMDVEEIDIQNVEKVSTGFSSLDKVIYGSLMGCFTIFTGYTGCVDCDTEYFNGTEWKKISEYTEGNLVLQYNRDGSAKLVKPNHYHKYPSEYLWNFKTRNLDQCLCDEHNVYFLHKRSNELLNLPFKKIKEIHEKNITGFEHKFITSFNFGGAGLPYEDVIIRLMVASICDGTYDYSITNMNAKSFYTCRFQLKKDRKKERLLNLLKLSGLVYRYAHSTMEGYDNYYVQLPERIKLFDKRWFNCSNHQLQVICDECLHWDGSLVSRKKRFYTTIKDNAEFIQFAFSACGHRATINTIDRRGRKYLSHNKMLTTKSIDYEVYVAKKDITGIGTGGNKINPKIKINQYKTTDGFKYCFSVDSGMLVLRRNNKIFITGNCGKSTVANQATIISPIEHGYKSFVFSGELSEGQMKNWIVKPIAGKNHIMEWVNLNQPKGYTVTHQAKKAIAEYYRESILLYDDNDEFGSSSSSLIEEMEYSYRKYGTKFFLIDNLMCIDFSSTTEDKWDSQKRFIVQLMKFTNKYGVNVNLILHPKKPSMAQTRTAYDLHGASEIANLCHRMLWIKRLENDQDGYNVEVEIVKDRPCGRAGKSCKMYYDDKSMRVYSNQEELNRVYKWEAAANVKYEKNISDKLVCNINDNYDQEEAY